MKKINISSLLFLSFLLLFFVACEEEVVIDDDLLQPSLVVNSFITPDSLVKVKLFKSIPINSAFTNAQISNAQITLYEDGEKKEELTLTYHLTKNYGWQYHNTNEFDTTFTFSAVQTKAKLGKTYRLEILSPGFEKATSETIVPNPVEIVSIDTSTSITNNGQWQSLTNNFKLRFKEPVDEKNYYRLIIHETRGTLYRYSEMGDTIEMILISKDQGDSYFESDDNVLTFESEDANSFIFGSLYNEYGIFSDEIINGKEYELSFCRKTPFTTEANLYYNPTKGEFAHFTIDLQSIPYETYLFLKSIEGQIYNDNMPFSEPVPIFSNIENGLGIFGSYSSSTISAMFGTYPMEGIKYNRPFTLNPF